MENQTELKIGEVVTLLHTDRPRMVIGEFIKDHRGDRAVCYYGNIITGHVDQVEIFVGALKKDGAPIPS